MTSLGTRSSRCLLNTHHHSLLRTRNLATSRVLLRSKTKDILSEPNDRWNYNRSALGSDPTPEQISLKQVTANVLEHEPTPPKGVKMLVRDFIEDSLYNPNYGYFPKQATIFDQQGIQFDFPKLRDSSEFQEEVARRYEGYGADKPDGPGRQLWHTPTELFKPHYGHAMAQCLVSEYLLKYFPYEDFVIYEIGAGNGSLAESILDYLKEYYPDVYDRTRYNIIEISASLAKLQKKRLGKHHSSVRITNQSIFHWKTRESAPCFFLAMEVIDNFAHDVVRYDLRTMKPYQGVVTIDKEGEFDMIFSPVTDPLIASFLKIRDRLGHSPPISAPLQHSELLRKMYTSLPFAPNLSTEEYIPTRLLSLLKSLRNHFPRHRLLLSDFSSLPDTIPGVNSPVVQTRFRNITVPCSTLLVRQGYFDIFFPTNFDRLRDMYEYILSQPYSKLVGTTASPLNTSSSPVSLGAGFFNSTQKNTNRRHPVDGVSSTSGLPVGERKSSVFTHSEFMETYADLSRTTLKNGENPMIDFYKNVKFLF